MLGPLYDLLFLYNSNKNNIVPDDNTLTYGGIKPTRSLMELTFILLYVMKFVGNIAHISYDIHVIVVWLKYLTYQSR